MQLQEIHVLSLDAFFFSLPLSFNFYTAAKGLDWKELEELLNPNFDWKAAVQTTLGTNTSLKEVCCLVVCSLVVCLSYVLSQQLWPTI